MTVQVNLEQLQSERDDMEKEFEEIKRQLEEDTDKEIEDMKERWGLTVLSTLCL